MFPVILIGAAIGVLFILIARSRHKKLRFVDGRLVEASAGIPGRVRTACEDIARRSKLTGVIGLLPDHGARFSLSIGEADRQRFRNVIGGG